jgi:hypothetical protein
MTRRLTALLLLLLLALTGCSRKKTLTPDDLKSQLTSAISFASEEEMFIDYIRAGRATSNFAEQHAAYLDAEIERSADELNKAVPESGTGSELQRCRIQLNQLREELWKVGIHRGDSNALSASKARVEAIRHDLEQAKSAL